MEMEMDTKIRRAEIRNALQPVAELLNQADCWSHIGVDDRELLDDAIEGLSLALTLLDQADEESAPLTRDTDTWRAFAAAALAGLLACPETSGHPDLPSQAADFADALCVEAAKGAP